MILRTTGQDPRFQALLEDLDAALFAMYGDVVKGELATFNESLHLSTVVLVMEGEKALGCGALKPLGEGLAEIKRVFVSEDARGRGYSKQILAELETWARELHYTTLWVETGEKQAAAIGLYASSGYQRIPNYPPYEGIPQCLCFSKTL